MKNTKHTENLDNSTPQEITSQSKRKILTSIGVSSGILGASALSQQWTKPIVNSIILPAHAQSTPMTTMAMGTTDMMGMPDPTTTMMPDPTTTMMPTTATPASRIMVSTDNTGGMIGDGNTGTAGMVTYQIRLSEMPSNTVTVTVAASPVANATVDTDPTAGTSTTPHELMFTLNNYDMWQPVTVTAAAIDVMKDTEVTVTFTAKGGGYDEMREEMITVVNDDPESPTMVMAKATQSNSGGSTNGEVEVSWTKPATSAGILYYLVHQASSAIGTTQPTGDAAEADVNAGSTDTSAKVTGLARGTYHFAVTAAFKDAEGATVVRTAQAGGADSTAVVIN